LFTAAQGARLRMRVKTDAARLRIELRVQLDDGFRLVDALLDVPGNDWTVLDIPLNVLRAGRYRDEPGWIPGRSYSSLLVTPAANPDQPLIRHELAIDDLLIFVPQS
jgi:hypothetical protein